MVLLLLAIGVRRAAARLMKRQMDQGLRLTTAKGIKLPPPLQHVDSACIRTMAAPRRIDQSPKSRLIRYSQRASVLQNPTSEFDIQRPKLHTITKHDLTAHRSHRRRPHP